MYWKRKGLEMPTLTDLTCCLELKASLVTHLVGGHRLTFFYTKGKWSDGPDLPEEAIQKTVVALTSDR